MDPALLREREAYRKKAINAPLVESRKRPTESDTQKSHHHKKAKVEKEKPVVTKEYDYKTASGSSQYKFAILAKIVGQLKKFHQDGTIDPVSLDDILEETNQTDIGPRNKYWLETEALLNNTKIEVIDGNYRFKPVYHVRDRKGLLALVKEHERHGLGSISLEDVEESVPNAAKVIKELKESVIRISRIGDKKESICYNNKAYYLPEPADEDIQKCWRSVAVEGVDEKKLEEYLVKHNIIAMHSMDVKKVATQKRKQVKKKARTGKIDNEHLGDILKDYSEK